LLAAFNGGFKGNSGYAACVDGAHVYDTPQPGLGTIVPRSDNSLQTGTWGRDLTSLRGWALRQNLPPLIASGRLAPGVDDWTRWGATLGGVSQVWRSAVGMTHDGQLLIADPHLGFSWSSHLR